MGKVKDLEGMIFGRLTVLKFSSIEKNKAMWLCLCECGEKKICSGNSIKQGKTKSCGCLHLESVIENVKGRKKKRDEGIRKENKIHPLYIVLNAMIQRCYNEKCKEYKWYGVKGIHVSEEWKNDKKKFIEWGEENGYRKGLQIDRIDPSGNYEPQNCQFLTRVNNLKKVRKDNLTTGKLYSRGRTPKFEGFSDG